MMKKIIILMFMVCVYSGSAFAYEFGDVTIHGFISQGYMDSDNNNWLGSTEKGTFEFNEMGINFSTELTEDLHVGVQLFSRDLGTIGNDKITLDWAFADYHWKDWFGIRAGKMKMPLGLYNETRDVDMLRTSIIMPQGVYQEAWRDTIVGLKGFGTYGEIPLGFLGGVNYQAQTGVNSIDTDSGIAKVITDTGWVVPEDFEMGKAYSGRFIWDTPLSGLRLGGSIVQTSFDIICSVPMAAGAIPDIALNVDNARCRVYSLEYTFRNLVVAGEYQYWDLKITPDIRRMAESIGWEYEVMQATVDGVMGDGLEINLNMQGYYWSASYRFTDWLEIGAYTSAMYQDPDDKSGKKYTESGLWNWPNSLPSPLNPAAVAVPQPEYHAWLKDNCVSVRFDINEFWTLKLERHDFDGCFNVSAYDNMPDLANDPTGTETGTQKDWVLYAAKVTFSF